MKVYFIGSGPGAPDLITVRGRDILARTRVCIYAGSLVNPALLGFLPDGAEIHDSSSMTLEDMGVVYGGARDRGLDVARLHTGDLSLYSA
ncbi:MAG: SAM-dependent methyltransferase, partial [Spirochaetota bacterium]